MVRVQLQSAIVGCDRLREATRTGERVAAIVMGIRPVNPIQGSGTGGVVLGAILGRRAPLEIVEQLRRSGRPLFGKCTSALLIAPQPQVIPGQRTRGRGGQQHSTDQPEQPATAKGQGGQG